MWIHKIAVLLCCLILSSGASANPVANSMANIRVSSKQVRLNKGFADKLAKVKSSGVIVVYPTVVPARFSLASVKVSGDDARHPDFQLEFRDKGRFSFTVESAYTGIGDGPDGDRTLKVESKVFGPVEVDVFKPRSEGNDTPDVYYLSSWVTPKKKVSPDATRHYHFYGTGVTDKEALSIIQSLGIVE